MDQACDFTTDNYTFYLLLSGCKNLTGQQHLNKVIDYIMSKLKGTFLFYVNSFLIEERLIDLIYKKKNIIPLFLRVILIYVYKNSIMKLETILTFPVIDIGMRENGRRANQRKFICIHFHSFFLIFQPAEYSEIHRTRKDNNINVYRLLYNT